MYLEDLPTEQACLPEDVAAIVAECPTSQFRLVLKAIVCPLRI